MKTKRDFLNMLGVLAKVCSFQDLTSELAALYDRALSRFGYDRAVAAIEEAVIERRGNERMPSIGDLVARCSPQILDTDQAVEVAARIWGAIAACGYANPSDARNRIGEIGWHIVEINGGWQRICETAQSKDVGVWKAQLRDHAAAAIRRHKAGVLEAAPRFGEVASSNKMASLVGEVLKKTESHNGSTGVAGGVSRAPSSWIEHAEGDSRVPQKIQS